MRVVCEFLNVLKIKKKIKKRPLIYNYRKKGRYIPHAFYENKGSGSPLDFSIRWICICNENHMRNDTLMQDIL